MCAAGMRTLSKKISPWLSARWPSLFSGLPRDTPGASSGTRHDATPPATPLPESMAQNSVATVAIVPFDTHAAFCPLITVVMAVAVRGAMARHLAN